jgi:hypothetical protein
MKQTKQRKAKESILHPIIAPHCRLQTYWADIQNVCLYIIKPKIAIRENPDFFKKSHLKSIFLNPLKGRGHYMIQGEFY